MNTIALNRRIVKKAYDGGSLDWTDHYYYNTQWQALEVRRDSGSGEDEDPREQYVWHPYYIDALATRWFDEDTDGNLSENNDGQHYFTHDANFNVTAVLETDGDVLERYHYTPYGTLVVLDSDFTADIDGGDGKSDIANPYTFTGRRFDDETGLYPVPESVLWGGGREVRDEGSDWLCRWKRSVRGTWTESG